jgi:hypothetical protein
MLNPLHFMYEEDSQTLSAIANKQSAKSSVSFHQPTETEDYLTYYGDPRRQPLVVHITKFTNYKSYWDE